MSALKLERVHGPALREVLYRKLGYREFGRLDDFPTGHRRCRLTKAL
jgi:hypothetical protein